jgi:hypothetical protein
MYVCFFESLHGYNSQARVDRIYFFNTRETVKYLLDVNVDLIDKSMWLRFFIHKIKKYLRQFAIARKINAGHIRSVEIGETHWTTIFHSLDKSI